LPLVLDYFLLSVWKRSFPPSSAAHFTSILEQLFCFTSALFSHENQTILITAGTTGIGRHRPTPERRRRRRSIVTVANPKTLAYAQSPAPACTVSLTSDSANFRFSPRAPSLGAKCKRNRAELDGAFLTPVSASFGPIYAMNAEHFDDFSAQRPASLLSSSSPAPCWPTDAVSLQRLRRRPARFPNATSIPRRNPRSSRLQIARRRARAARHPDQHTPPGPNHVRP